MKPMKTTTSRNLPKGLATILVLVALWRGWQAKGANFEQWLLSEKSVATQKLVGNILANGAVVASPSTADPNYYFHWVRDAGLAMDAIVSLYNQSSDAADRQRYWTLLNAYLDFSLGNQTTNNPRSEPGRGLGEPKFNTDGSAFTGDWGRPQDDSPALRAITFTRLANGLLDSGDSSQIGLVKTKLYDSTLPTSSLIKRDLEYVSHNWRSTCFDPWEEVRGHHFYTRMVQRRALRDGAALAQRLNDSGAADWYRAQADVLEPALRGHWDEGQGIIRVTLDRDDGLDYKSSNLDAAVILAVLHANRQGDDFFTPTDDMVLATATILTSTFDNLFPINGTKNDFDGEPLGTAIGRYPEDRYSGQAGSYSGNGWVLCTAALGELYYRAAGEWGQKGQIAITARNKSFFMSLDSTRFQGLQVGQSLATTDQAFQDIITGLRSAGDRQLRRIRYHAFPDGSLSEQMNRQTGFMQSARDLTWNYASILTALGQRPATPSLTSVNARANIAARRVVSSSPPIPASAGVPVNRLNSVPMTRLNRGGIPVPNGPPNADAEAPITGKPSRRNQNPNAELTQAIAELRTAIEKLSDEIHAMSAERMGHQPPAADHRKPE
jgi:glucoamylase